MKSVWAREVESVKESQQVGLKVWESERWIEIHQEKL